MDTTTYPQPGDLARVTRGPWKDYVGNVQADAFGAVKLAWPGQPKSTSLRSDDGLWFRVEDTVKEA